jgi:hypothetical protein
MLYEAVQDLILKHVQDDLYRLFYLVLTMKKPPSRTAFGKGP